MPEVVKINKISEPIIKATILLPDDYLGAVMKLCTEEKRDSEGFNICKSKKSNDCLLSSFSRGGF